MPPEFDMPAIPMPAPTPEMVAEAMLGELVAHAGSLHAADGGDLPELCRYRGRLPNEVTGSAVCQVERILIR